MKRTISGRRRTAARAGFTLVELIVVVAIIALLMGLLVAALPGVKKKAQDNATLQYLTGISSSCEAYFAAYGAYPGPFGPADTAASAVGGKLSGNQNLFIGLTVPVYVSGTPWYSVGANSQPSAQTVTINGVAQKAPAPFGSSAGWRTVAGTSFVNAFNVGDFSGPIDFSTSPPRTHTPAFFSPAAKEVSLPNGNNTTWFPYGVQGATGFGSALEFPALVDRYPDAMPILYFRRTGGSEGSATVNTDQVGRPDAAGSIASAAAYVAASPYPYYLGDNFAYTSSTGLRSTRNTPYDQTNAGTPNFNEKDLAGLASNRPLKGNMSGVSIIGRGAYILVSAGNDHLYGQSPKTKSNDDITVVAGN